MTSFSLMLRESIRRSPVPTEIPASERGTWKKVDSACQRLFPPLWGQFLPGLHRDDARLYAAGVALTRDLYLAEGAALTRRDRELVALAVSVDTGSPVGILQHARLLGVLGDRRLADLVQRRAVRQIDESRARGLVQTALERRWANVVRRERTRRHRHDPLRDALPRPRGGCRRPPRGTREFDPVPAAIVPARPNARPHPFVAARVGSVVPLRRRRTRPVSYIPTTAPRSSDGTSFPGGETRTMTARFVVGAIQSVASELFDNEVLFAVRQHVSQWQGEAIPLTGTWTHSATRMVGTESNRRLAEFGLLVARCPERVSPEGLLQACDGSERRRLALVTFASCIAALRLVELLTDARRRGH